MALGEGAGTTREGSVPPSVHTGTKICVYTHRDAACLLAYLASSFLDLGLPRLQNYEKSISSVKFC